MTDILYETKLSSLTHTFLFHVLQYLRSQIKSSLDIGSSSIQNLAFNKRQEIRRYALQKYPFFFLVSISNLQSPISGQVETPFKYLDISISFCTHGYLHTNTYQHTLKARVLHVFSFETSDSCNVVLLEGILDVSDGKIARSTRILASFRIREMVVKGNLYPISVAEFFPSFSFYFCFFYVLCDWIEFRFHSYSIHVGYVCRMWWEMAAANVYVAEYAS